ncbi:MAG: ABC transporter ATP-binding protein [Acidobacteriota bacterium]
MPFEIVMIPVAPDTASSGEFLLQVRHLRTIFQTEQGSLPAVDDVSFNVQRGETLGVVGESGCGKSVTGLSILRLVGPPGKIVQGEVLFQETNLRELSRSEMRKVRGRQIAMVFQEPMSALDPIMKIGVQMIEGMQEHLGYVRKSAWKQGVELLQRMGLPQAAACMNAYPHQLSGGMCQRVLIAMALACHPQLLIADEPATALDVTTQAQILDLLRELKSEQGLTMLMISHDFGVIADVADWIAVMYAGQVVEYGPAEQIFYRPSHPYTQRLLACVAGIYSDVKQEYLPVVEGTVPYMGELPSGCRFHPRCPEAEADCRKIHPELFPIGEEGASHWVRCLKRENVRVKPHAE